MNLGSVGHVFSDEKLFKSVNLSDLGHRLIMTMTSGNHIEDSEVLQSSICINFCS